MHHSIIVRVIWEGTTYDLDIQQDVPLRLDVSAIENTSIGEFFGIGSQTFELPGTKFNNRFFGHAYNIGAEDIPGFSDTIDGMVIVNGDTVLKGQFQLLNIVKDEDGYVNYKVQITDGVVQFKDAIQSKLVKDADWSDYTHQLTTGSILDSWQNNLLDGKVYYPLADYGLDDPENQGNFPTFGFANGGTGTYFDNLPIQPQQFLPAIKAKDTIEKICEQVGFTATGSFINSGYFSNLFILPKAQEEMGIVVTGSEQPTGYAINGYNQVIPIETGPAIGTKLAANNIVVDPLNKFTVSGSEGFIYYTADGTGEYEASTNIGFFNPVAFSQGEVTIDLKLVRGTFPNTSFVMATDSITLSSQDGFNTFNLSVGASWYSTTSEEVWVYVDYYQSSGTPTADLNLFGVSSKLQVDKAPLNYIGANVDMALQWPSDLKSIDILTGLIKQFNLVVYPSTEQDKTLVFEQFDDWIREGEVKDWTDKWDTATRVEINHTVDEEPAELLFTNGDDSDRFSVEAKESEPYYQYGTLRVLADNNISQGSKKIDNTFGPVVLGGPFISGSVKQDGTPTYNIDLGSNFAFPHLYKFDSNNLKSYKFRPRLGFKSNNLIPSGSSILIGTSFDDNTRISGSYGTLSNVNGLPAVDGAPDLHFNNTYFKFAGPGLNLGNTISNFDRYWKTYIDSLYWEGNRKVTLDVLFSPEEYKDIKLNDIIFIKDQRYRINKIEGYNLVSDDIVTVELIRLFPAYSGQVDCTMDFTLSETDASFNFDAIKGGIAPTPTATPTPSPTVSPTPTISPTPTPTGFPINVNNCLEYTFVHDGVTNDYTYTYVLCGTTEITQDLLTIGSTETHCIVSGSVAPFQINENNFLDGYSVGYPGGTTIDITTGSSCTPTCTSYQVYNVGSSATYITFEYNECGTGFVVTGSVQGGTSVFVCSITEPTYVSGGFNYNFDFQNRGLCAQPTPTPTPSSTPTQTPTPTISPTPTPTPTSEGLQTRTIQGYYNIGTYGPCNEQRFPGPVYILSTVDYVQVGDVIYEDSGLTTRLEGWTHLLETATNKMWIMEATGVNAGEVLYEGVGCPTPTPTATQAPTPTPTPQVYTHELRERLSPDEFFCGGTYITTRYSIGGSTLSEGDQLWRDANLEYRAGTNYYYEYSTGKYWYKEDFDIGVTEIASPCPTPTATPTQTPTPTPSPTPTPTVDLRTYSGEAAWNSYDTICDGFGTNVTVYTNGPISIGNTVYDDAGLTNIFDFYQYLKIGNVGYQFPDPNTTGVVQNLIIGPCPTPTPTPTATATFETFNAAFTDLTSSLCNETNQGFVRGTYGTIGIGKIIYWDNGTTKATGWNYFRDEDTNEVWEVNDSTAEITGFYGTVNCPTPTPTPTPTTTPTATPLPTPTPTSSERYIIVEGVLCTQTSSTQLYNWFGDPNLFPAQFVYDGNSGWCMDMFYVSEGFNGAYDTIDCSSRFEYYNTCSDCQNNINQQPCS